MGKGLKRQFLGFSRLIGQDDLAEIKCFTNKLEKKFSLFPDRPSRQINLDPGYLSPAKLVLATIKDYNHRIYIGKNIYAEITLHFQGSSFKAWEWTYPDYKTKECIEFFNKVRKGHLKQIYP